MNELEEQVLARRTEFERAQRAQDNQLVDLGVLRKEVERAREERKFVEALMGEYLSRFETRIHISEADRYATLLAELKAVPGKPDLAPAERFEGQMKLLDASLARIESVLGGEVFAGKALTAAGRMESGKYLLVRRLHRFLGTAVWSLAGPPRPIHKAPRMRRVYSPPTPNSWNGIRRGGAVLITLGVFLVLPLTQLVSSYSKRELLITKVDSTVVQAPPAADPPPPPPPEEEPPPDPQPDLAEVPQTMTLSIDLDVAVGTGGAMATNLFDGSAEAARDLAQGLDVSDLDKPPTLIAAVPPSYPPELRRARIEGVVALVFLLTETGTVEDARVESSSRPEFERPALEAIRRWRFKPGMKDGEAVKTYMRQPIRFRVAG